MRISRIAGFESTATFLRSKLDIAGTPVMATSYVPAGRFATLYLPSREVTAVDTSPDRVLRARTVAASTATPAASRTEPEREELACPHAAIGSRAPMNRNRRKSVYRDREHEDPH